jgi:parvulin-like peptidyl-prolyl isomerase
MAGRALRAIFALFALRAGALAQNSVSASASLAPSDSVLVVRGWCDDCTVDVSKEQFDLWLGVLFPAGLNSKARFAKSYADVLAFASAARQRELDLSPEYLESMRWLEEKTLADLLRRRLEKESKDVSPSEIQAYYREQSSRFDEVRLRRLVVPKSNLAAADARAFQRRAQEVAAALRERAARGEDLDQLQKDCYESLGFSGTPPSTDAGYRRRTAFSPEVSAAVFSLQPGEVSQAEQETYSFVIYKVEAKRKLPCEQVRDEIAAEVAKAKLEKAIDSITANVRVELNGAYFETASTQ